MTIIDLLQLNPGFFYLTVGIFSLLIGSFLNAAIYRIPVMLEKEWQNNCKELLEGEEATVEEGEKFNLLTPRSQCPHCQHMITAIENIPVFSYLFLRGKCSDCGSRISIQYPLIELFTMLTSLLVAWKFGPSSQTFAALFLLWSLITLSVIDAKTMYLPDDLTLPLMWLGIAVSFFPLFVDLKDSVIGAMAGYLFLWGLYHVFKLVTNKEGMGYGDFKLLAAIGAWGGWQILPFTIFASSLLGAIYGIGLMILARSGESKPMPFGPWLALAGFIAFLWRDEVLHLMKAYFYIQ